MSIQIDDRFDVIIIGGGPAGLSAGIVASLKGLKTAVFEGGTWGGLLSTLYPEKRIYNFPGTPRIRAGHLAAEWVRQAADHGVFLIKERVTKIHPDLKVSTEENEYQAQSIIIATGMRPNQLGVKGENKFSQRERGLYYYVTDPEIFHNRRVLVVGGGDTAIDAVIDLSSVAKKVYLAHRRDEFRASETNLDLVKKDELAEILTFVTPKEIIGDRKVEGVILEKTDNNEEIELRVEKVILAVGLVPNTEIFEGLGLEFKDKFLITDPLQRTNIPGIFAVGDIVSPYQLAVVAASQGALAAHGAYLYLREPYWTQEHLEKVESVKPQIL